MSDLASLSNSFGTSSGPLAFLDGSCAMTVSTSCGGIVGKVPRGGGGSCLISARLHSVNATEVPKKSSSACSSLSVAMLLSFL